MWYGGSRAVRMKMHEACRSICSSCLKRWPVAYGKIAKGSYYFKPLRVGRSAGLPYARRCSTAHGHKLVGCPSGRNLRTSRKNTTSFSIISRYFMRVPSDLRIEFSQRGGCQSDRIIDNRYTRYRRAVGWNAGLVGTGCLEERGGEMLMGGSSPPVGY